MKRTIYVIPIAPNKELNIKKGQYQVNFALGALFALSKALNEVEIDKKEFKKFKEAMETIKKGGE